MSLTPILAGAPNIHIDAALPQKKEEKEKESLISRVFWKTIADMEDLVRIDIPIRNFYHDPCAKNALRLGYDVFWLSLFGSLAMSVGVAAVASQVGITLLAFNGFREYQKDIGQPLLPRPISEYLPASTALPYLALGAASLFVMGPVISAVLSGLIQAMESRGITFPVEQDAVSLIKMPGIMGILFSLYASIGAPLLEEIVFRGIVQESVSDSSQSQGQSQSLTWDKMKAIVKTSLLFGLIHGSPQQGWTNVPVIAATTLMGVFFGVLKEITGDLWAPIGLHAANNTFVTLRLRNII